jgi:hypothetical protein
LDSIVTFDETWVHYFTPESKIDSPPPQKKWKQFFQHWWSLLLCSGIQRVSFTWIFLRLKKKTINVH